MSKHFEKPNSYFGFTFQIKPKGAQFSFVSNLKFYFLSSAEEARCQLFAGE